MRPPPRLLQDLQPNKSMIALNMSKNYAYKASKYEPYICTEMDSCSCVKKLAMQIEECLLLKSRFEKVQVGSQLL